MSDALVLTGLPETEAGDPQREIRAGMWIAIGFFVLFLGWAALLPLDAGVHAAGAAVRADGYLARPLREGDVLSRIAAVLRVQADAAQAAPPPPLRPQTGSPLQNKGPDERTVLTVNGRITLSGTGAQLLGDDRVRQAYLGL